MAGPEQQLHHSCTEQDEGGLLSAVRSKDKSLDMVYNPLTSDGNHQPMLIPPIPAKGESPNLC